MEGTAKLQSQQAQVCARTCSTSHACSERLCLPQNTDIAPAAIPYALYKRMSLTRLATLSWLTSIAQTRHEVNRLQKVMAWSVEPLLAHSSQAHLRQFNPTDFICTRFNRRSLTLTTQACNLRSILESALMMKSSDVIEDNLSVSTNRLKDPSI